MPFLTLIVDDLLEMMRLAGWGWFVSVSVVLIGAAFCTLVNKTPSFDFMDESITMRMMDHSTYSVPLGSGRTVGGLWSLLVGDLRIKVLLRSFFLMRHLNRRHCFRYIISCQYLCILA